MKTLTDIEQRAIFKIYSPNGALERKIRDFILNDCNAINGERICDEPPTNAEMDCVLRAFFKNLCEKYPHFLQLKTLEQAREFIQKTLDDPQIFLRNERQGDPAPSADDVGYSADELAVIEFILRSLGRNKDADELAVIAFHLRLLGKIQ